jgi:hypothetical protein
MALIQIPVAASSPSPPIQIVTTINGPAAGTVRYTVPTGRVFNGLISSSTAGQQTRINSVDVPFNVGGTTVVFIAGTVIASQTTTAGNALVGVESDA